MIFARPEAAGSADDWSVGLSSERGDANSCELIGYVRVLVDS